MSTAKRVIKNTGYLYMKMGITVFVSLYTTRLILSSLGASDFGIFNVVGGAIAMLGFLNSTMANATQRFMSFAEGEGDERNKIKVFNVSMVLHFVVAIFTFVLLLIVMHPLFNGILTIETDRALAAKIVYLSLIISTCLTIVNVPYDAIMNAHENMRYYAIVGVLESVIRLFIALGCVYTNSDKLILYGILTAAVPLVTLTIMKIYCHKKYSECIFAPKEYWDIHLVKGIATFSGWNFLTAITSLFTAQGLSLVLNHFYGTVLNAAQGIANQLNGQMTSFSTTMLKALNPVIVKNAGAREIDSMNSVTLAGCKYSTFLILLFAVPFSMEINYILSIWLDVVPEWTTVFCVVQLVLTVISEMAAPAATSIYAQGNIKYYAIWKSLMNIAPLIVTYICFYCGGSPYWLYIPMIIFWGIGGDVVILYCASKLCGISFKQYKLKVIKPLIIVTSFMYLAAYLTVSFLEESFIRLLLTCFATTVTLAVTVYLFAMTSEERKSLFAIFHKEINYN